MFQMCIYLQTKTRGEKFVQVAPKISLLGDSKFGPSYFVPIAMEWNMLYRLQLHQGIKSTQRKLGKHSSKSVSQMLYALMPRVFHSRKIIFILPQRPRLSWATCWLMHISPILLHHKFFLLILDFKQLGIHPLLSFQVLQLVCPLMSF